MRSLGTIATGAAPHRVRQAILCLVALAWSASPAVAQLLPQGGGYFDPFSRSSSFGSVLAPGPVLGEPVRRYKQGFFQRVDVTGGAVFANDDDLDVRDLTASLSVAVPLGSLENLLVITPSFGVTEFASNLPVPVPDHVYETGVTFLNRVEWSPRWTTLTLVQPAVRSDFQGGETNVRLFGMLLAEWAMVPDRLALIFGAVHLGRDDLPVVLPAAGFRWTPTERWAIDAVMPRPRIAYLLQRDDSPAETWLYAQGGLGGTTWDVERVPGLRDELSYKDFRILLGVERIREGGGGFFAEGGYVFGRHLQYESLPFEADLSDGWTVRGGIRF